MHGSMLLLTLPLVALVSLIGVRLIRKAVTPTSRVTLALWSLAAPALALGACALSLLSRYTRANYICGNCSEGAIPLLLLTFLAGTFIVALLLGTIRSFLLAYTLHGRLLPAPAYVEQFAGELAARVCGRRPELLLVASDLPVAFTFGLLRPRVALSTWLVDNLDRQELQATLAHELAHAAARDYGIIWLATLLRDATFYLPWAWEARRALIAGKEMLADETTVSATGRPLALASALAKVWQRSLSAPPARLGVAPRLSEAGASIEARVEWLLGQSQRPQGEYRAHEAPGSLIAHPSMAVPLNLIRASSMALALVAICALVS